jgi:hypothetical protein
LWVDDVDAIYRRALASGFDPEASPANTPWGERSFHIHDPPARRRSGLSRASKKALVKGLIEF